ncbi:enoyl-CoA delta isomerase 1, mitochondrial-like [Contarinia nasturtii]|uniref:enoyl-CoA delta isomerase 1, mitochondrial-like n=1 Tax=Contarinia nasturtii TaxID=265458 RepID=UPI0012D37DE6|nr:enoyl-CoA delta isomerase 1, mitochondrial-like [Contarinia nasturtii]XP_031628190.1 enoyl-CoA delta isomerase 1, mitochondrial-like [Contarinia nasturtii]XP_031628191.1 enoyl-CoA delta isomerase 1, mitochondrial-like [Contarinia nasturtii]
MLSLKQCVQVLSMRCISMSASKLKYVNVAVDDKTGIATVEMNRPPVNSLNTPLLQELSTTLSDLTKNKSRGLILTSSSPTVFSAGLDILEMYKPDPERVKLFWTTVQEVWLKLYGSVYPTAAAINGHSPAGGCLLALSCEYRVMAPKLTIGLNETRLGIVAPTWFQASMQNVMSVRDTEKALTLGTMFSTDEALKVGLIDEVASDKQDAIKRCEQFLLQFAKISVEARAMTKRNCRGKAIADLENNREADLQNFLGFVNSPKVQRGLELYLESLKAKK